MKRPSNQRGVTIIEAMVSMAVLGISLLGIAQLQIVAASTNSMAQRLAVATSLATDLIENVPLWSYTDPRLTPADTITATTDPIVAARTVLPNVATITSSGSMPTFAEGGANALNVNALHNATTQYAGYTTNSLGGSTSFERYWSVFSVTSPTDNLENGKLVVVTVRWVEPAFNRGYRQITASTFLSNSGTLTQ